VLTFSHERLFLPTTPALPPIDMAPHLPQIRALLLAGQYQQAADLAVRIADEHGYGGLRWTDPFVPAFDLRVSETVRGELRDYSRGADYETGEVCVSWQDDLGPSSRHLFVSRADDVAVLKLIAARPGRLDCALRISSTPGPQETDHDNGSFLSRVAQCQRQRLGHVLAYRATFKQHHGRGVLGYQTAVRVVADGGQVVLGTNRSVSRVPTASSSLSGWKC